MTRQEHDKKIKRTTDDVGGVNGWIMAPTDLFTCSAVSDTPAIRADAATVYCAVTDATTHLLE